MRTKPRPCPAVPSRRVWRAFALEVGRGEVFEPGGFDVAEEDEVLAVFAADIDELDVALGRRLDGVCRIEAH